MMQMAKWLLLVALLLGLVGAAAYASVKMQRGLERLTQPQRGPNDPFPAAAGVAWEEVVLENEGLALGAWFVPPTAAADGAVLVYLHGFGGNRRSWQAEALAIREATGVGALLLDLRNSGASEGALTTWGIEEASDVKTAVFYLQSRADVNPDRIGLIGKSMGGGVAARAAAQMGAKVRLLVLQSTFSGMDDNWLAITTRVAGLDGAYERPFAWWAEWQSGIPFFEIRPREDVVTYGGPLLVLHGAKDQVVTVDQGQQLFAVAAEPKAYYEAAEAGHNNVFWQDQAAYIEVVTRFLQAHLLPPPSE